MKSQILRIRHVLISCNTQKCRPNDLLTKIIRRIMTPLVQGPLPVRFRGQLALEQ